VFIGACSENPTNSSSKNSATNSANKPDAEARFKQMFANAPQGSTPPNAKGAPNALITIEEFADFQCPTCGSMHPKVQEIRAAYGDRIRIIFRQFPLQMHPHGYEAACAAEAAGMQGKFWEMQNQLFSNQTVWSNAPDARKIFTDYAEKLGLDVQKFSDDMIGLPVKNRVDADLQRGRALAVSSTPTFFINNRPYEGDLNALRAAVDAELQKVEKAGSNPQSQTAAGGNTASSPTPAASNTSNTNK
jgi:protein-disulfide isomerase